MKNHGKWVSSAQMKTQRMCLAELATARLHIPHYAGTQLSSALASLAPSRT